MSYTVLALKWRPRRFEDLVGQGHVVQALVNSLAAERLHHAYLFAGTRGVGKTTVARILAKALNCDTGITPEPCGECAACIAIDEGRFVDLIEVDAASRTRVDDTRELLDNVQYMPTRGRFKVYLIDEVHMLSNHSFNALLKTLEEPPPHVKFLFATTDPQKLPVTVLSRCLQFNLKKLPVALIQEQLRRISAQENVEADDDGLRALARAADGSMRDALSLLDQGIAFGGGRIETAQVRSMLGSIDRGHVLRIVEALARRDGAAILAEVDGLDEMAPDYGAVLDELMAALQQIAIAQLVAERGGEDDERLRALAESLSPEDVQLYFQIAVNGRRDIVVCRDERMSFEMTLLRMLAFGLEEGAESAAGPGRARAVVRAKAAPKASASAPGSLAAPGPSAAPGPGPSVAASAASAADVAASRASAARVATEPSADAATSRAAPAAGDGARAGADAQGAVVDEWSALLKKAGITGAMRNLADHCELKGQAPGRLELILASDKANFNTDHVRGRLEKALGEHLGRPIRLAITVGKPPRPTPAEIRRASEDERIRRTREAIERDPNIKAVQAAFDAVLELDSIQPAEPE